MQIGLLIQMRAFTGPIRGSQGTRAGVPAPHARPRPAPTHARQRAAGTPRPATSPALQIGRIPLPDETALETLGCNLVVLVDDIGKAGAVRACKSAACTGLRSL